MQVENMAELAMPLVEEPLRFRLASAVPLLPWYEAALAEATGLVDALLKPLIPDEAERRRSVATLWAALQGIAALAGSGKLAVVSQDDPRGMGRLLVRRFLASGSDAQADRDC